LDSPASCTFGQLEDSRATWLHPCRHRGNIFDPSTWPSACEVQWRCRAPISGNATCACAARPCRIGAQFLLVQRSAIAPFWRVRLDDVFSTHSVPKCQLHVSPQARLVAADSYEVTSCASPAASKRKRRASTSCASSVSRRSFAKAWAFNRIRDSSALTLSWAETIPTAW